MSVNSQSASTAYASKINIVAPGTAANRTKLQALAVARLASDPNAIKPASAQVPTPAGDQNAGSTEAVVTPHITN